MKAPSAKSPPLTPEEIRGLRRHGHSIATIANMAYRRNGIGRAQVREILFPEINRG